MHIKQQIRIYCDFEFQLIEKTEVADKNKGNHIETISLSFYIDKYQEKTKTLEETARSKLLQEKGGAIITVSVILAIIASLTQIAGTLLK